MRSLVLCVLAVVAFLATFVAAAAPSAGSATAAVDKTWDAKADSKFFRKLKRDLFKTTDTREKSLARDKAVKKLLVDRLEVLKERNAHDGAWGVWAAQRRETQLDSLDKLRAALRTGGGAANGQADTGCHDCTFAGDIALKELDGPLLNNAINVDAETLTKGDDSSLYKRTLRDKFPDYTRKEGGW